MAPNVPQAGDRIWIEEHPESLAFFHVLCQERIDDADVRLARSNQFHAVWSKQSNVLTGRQLLGRRHRSYGDMDGISLPFVVTQQFANSGCGFQCLSPCRCIWLGDVNG